MSGMRLAAVDVPGDVDLWERLGFAAVDGAIALTNGAIRTGGDVGLAVESEGSLSGDVDGVPLRASVLATGNSHANGAIELDHVVLMTNSLERTSQAVADSLGLEQRRLRETEQVRQAFHRFGDVEGARGCIIEIVERPDMRTTTLWGVVVNVADLDSAIEAADGLVGAARSAVQPGRRIATVSRSAGLPLAVALMSN